MKVAVLGYGTVGRGVVEMLETSPGMICTKVLVRSGAGSDGFFVNDIERITGDSETDVVVECMGGTEDARRYAVKSLEAGKHFVTSNKALVCRYGPELQSVARQHNRAFLFSAACGGAMPVLLNLRIARQSDTVCSAGGILNGTVNYMLTKMQDENLTYGEALVQAQKAGYAEADPAADVSGLDTLRKIILISAVGFDSFYDEAGLPCEGIEHTDSEVMEILKREKLVLRLVGKCGIENGERYAFVQPVVFCSNSAEAAVRLNMNMAFWEGKNCGRMTVSGQGAGRYPTASNVLRDLTEIAGGRMSFLSESCIRTVCTAEKKCSYMIIENGKTEFTEPVSVVSMHGRAEQSRAKGNRFFFAETGKFPGKQGRNKEC